MNKTLTTALAAAALAVSAVAAPAVADQRVTLKAAKSGTSYYVMAVQLSEAAKSAAGLDVTVEESQGSVQNVKEAIRRPGGYVFTSPPSLVASAQAAKKPFEGETGYDTVRGLFPIPSLTMHWLVRSDSGVQTFADLAGKSFIAGGKGSFGERQTNDVFAALGIADKVSFVDVELNAAVPALKNNQVAGFATAGSYPAPNVTEAAAGTAVRLLSLGADDLAKVKGAKQVIPAGTYPGIDYDVTTISLPVNAYTVAATDDETAYKLTKAFWDGKAAMTASNPWWGGVTTAMLAEVGAKLHPGALKYYAEAGVAVPDALK